MFLKLLLISSILLGLAIMALSFRILFVKKGGFPETSIGRNKEMQKLGITCAKHDEMHCHKDGSGIGGCGC
jgi:hypothetical protein